MKMNLLFKAREGLRYQTIVSPKNSMLTFLKLDRIKLSQGEEVSGATTNDEEAALTILGGSCSISLIGKDCILYENIGKRVNVFDGNPTCVYIPRGTRFTVSTIRGVEALVVRSPCDIDLRPVLIEPHEVGVFSIGAANWRRDVRMIISPTDPRSQHLIIAETINPPGNWSTFPPHKHDEITDMENALEEIYYYKVNPPNGFAIANLYDYQGTDLFYKVGNDDVMIMTKYHTIVSTPGTTLYYFWALAGKSKEVRISIDPAFAWLRQVEAVLKEMTWR